LDEAFSFEIGSGLLAEVRRLQSLIAERDKAIQDMKEEKDEQAKTLENLRSSLRQQEKEASEFHITPVYHTESEKSSRS
jgi:cell division protein FtsB